MRACSRPIALLAVLCLVALVAGCNETKTEFPTTNLRVNLVPCLGASSGGTVETQCRGYLNARVADAGENACLVIRAAAEGGEDAVHRVPFAWRNSRLELVGDHPGYVGVKEGQSIRGALFFFSDGMAANRCHDEANGYRPDDECSSDISCVAKLAQAQSVIVPGDGSALIEFKVANTDHCSIEWAQGGAMGAPAEVCNFLDDDCDGIADEGLDDCECEIGDTRQCGVNTGICQVGVQRCVLHNGMAQFEEECEGAIFPDDERCTIGDAEPLDEDCDGMVDEGNAASRFDEIGDVCTVGEGACRVDGTLVCDITGSGVRCDAIAGVAGDELCGDNIDNDCDGRVDEDFNVGVACRAGVGACENVGQYICNPDNLTRTSCNAVAGGASIEQCGDLVDNDCDGMVDEGFALGVPCQVGTGLCEQTGQLICDRDDLTGDPICDAVPLPSGEALCSSDEPPLTCGCINGEPDRPGICELCDDNLDNDCDGEIDEGYPMIGDDCEVGIGECRVQGVLICDPEDRTRVRCNRDPAMAQPELCDQRDNDCDGSVDEGWDELVLEDPSNCGDCGIVCGVAHSLTGCRPVAGDLRAECFIRECDNDWVDLNGVYADGCECNRTEDDVPDLLFADTDCDGVDGAEDDAVFVSTRFGDNNGTGGRDQPYETLDVALVVARQTQRDIYMDLGIYDLRGQTLTVPAGVDIYGGYNFDRESGNWPRNDRTINQTLIRGSAQLLRYENLDQPTRLGNVVLHASDALGDSLNSIAVVAVDVGDGHLMLRNVRLESGAGSQGDDGDDGVSISQAQPGNTGTSFNQVPPGVGGTAGINPQCAAGTAGGRGGDGANADGVLGNAVDGDGAGGLSGGAGGPGAAAGVDGAPGEAGDGGENGGDGASGGPEGDIDPATGLWRPRSSTGGRSGTNGGGGGGGGGGGSDGGTETGGGGGGGGAGGCGGTGGGPAVGGGGSFALYIRGGTVTIVRSEFVAGHGGSGGQGGRGGLGGPGGAGGPAGSGCEGCGTGGRGGRGGDGGCGGDGAGGDGGPTFAIMRVQPSVGGLALSNVSLDEASTLTAGDAGGSGAGGRRDGCGDPAPRGAAGYAGPIGCCILDGNSCTGALDQCP